MTVVDHAPAQLEATLKAPGQPDETVRILSHDHKQNKYLVAYSPIPGYDLGEVGATVTVPASMLTNIHPVH